MMEEIDLTKLTDQELKEYKQQAEFEISRFDVIQKTKKIQLNSAYGSLGNEHFRFFDVRLAEAVTLSGQFVIKWIEREINEFLNEKLKTENVVYCIALNTDSIYLCLGELVKSKGIVDVDEKIDYLERYSKEIIEPEITSICDRAGDYVNMKPGILKMKREVIASTGIWTAKNRYIIAAHDEEGIRHTEPKIKVVGIGSKRSNTPQICKDRIKEIFKVILFGKEKENIEFVEKFKEEFCTLGPEDVATPSTANNMKKYSDGGGGWLPRTPVHVKASILYNRLLEEHELTNYDPIHEGDKIKYVYLKDPNPFKNNAIACVSSLPHELELNEYIDFEKMFELNFINHLKPIYETIGWDYEEKPNIFDIME